MKLEKGSKIIIKKATGKSSVEIKRHKDPIMDNIYVVNTIGSTKYKDSWITENDLENWIKYLKTEGYTELNISKDEESSKKNNRKKS